MKKVQEDSSRRAALKTMLRGAGLMGLGGAAWGGVADGLQASELTIRPPAALKEAEFVKACIRCGSCVEACPYDTLALATPDDRTAIGTPYFKPRTTPCYLCTDAPCVKECPSGALDIGKITENDLLNINKSKMGVAVVDQNSCIAFWGIQCDACYRACPLLGEAINLKFERNDRTGKHAIIEPVVNRELCTGCGLCEHACITEKPSIVILPVDIANGKAGSHYIKSWDKNDEKRINTTKEKSAVEANTAEDYLNDPESLFDD
ncbi:MAG: ferredoxin-type protein NapG [Chlorobi bacterium]|nr:ferredoxin-type protein NapG [Chlorobiota bacterium]